MKTDLIVVHVPGEGVGRHGEAEQPAHRGRGVLHAPLPLGQPGRGHAHAAPATAAAATAVQAAEVIVHVRLEREVQVTLAGPQGAGERRPGQGPGKHQQQGPGRRRRPGHGRRGHQPETQTNRT